MESLEGHIYHYRCKRWYGERVGFSSILTKRGVQNDDLQNVITSDAQNKLGSQTCDTNLIQTYEILVKPLKTYPSITSVAMNLNLGKS
tara:strand:- start:122 stop:385 length:264 start_codon:yes stop_codon:yes gene_type:complete